MVMMAPTASDANKQHAMHNKQEASRLKQPVGEGETNYANTTVPHSKFSHELPIQLWLSSVKVHHLSSDKAETKMIIMKGLCWLNPTSHFTMFLPPQQQGKTSKHRGSQDSAIAYTTWSRPVLKKPLSALVSKLIIPHWPSDCWI